MSKFADALAAGYSKQEIVTFLRERPGYDERINEALSSGYSEDEIVDHLHRQEFKAINPSATDEDLSYLVDDSIKTARKPRQTESENIEERVQNRMKAGSSRAGAEQATVFDLNLEEKLRQRRNGLGASVRGDIGALGLEQNQNWRDANQKLRQDAGRERTWGEAAQDVGVQLLEGGQNIAGAVPDLIAPDSEWAKFHNKAAAFWNSKQSEPLKARAQLAGQAIDMAGEEGVIAQVVEAASQYWDDPVLASRFVITNLPSMIPGIAAAKLAHAGALARGATAARAMTAGTVAAGGVNAGLNAGGARGEAYEDIKQTLIKQGMDEAMANDVAMRESMVPAMVGGITGAFSGSTGLERAFAGGFGRPLMSGVVELAGEQAEEVLPKLTTNLVAGRYDGRSPGQDIGRTMVETAIGSSPGAALAGGMEAMGDGTPDGTRPTGGRGTPQEGGPRPIDDVVSDLFVDDTPPGVENAQGGTSQSRPVPAQGGAVQAAGGFGVGRPKSGFNKMGEFADFLDQERADLAGRRVDMVEQQAAQQQADIARRIPSEVETKDAQVLAAQQRTVMEQRMADIERAMQTTDPIAAFSELRASKNQPVLPEDAAVIERRMASAQAFQSNAQQLPEPAPSLPDGGMSDLVPERREHAPAVSPLSESERFARIDAALAQGFKPQGRALVHPKSGKKINLNTAERDYLARVRRGEAPVSAQPGEPHVTPEVVAPGREGQGAEPRGSQEDRGTGGTVQGGGDAAGTGPGDGAAVPVGDALPDDAALSSQGGKYDGLTYEKFKEEMQALLREAGKYTPNQAGFGHFAEKMAELADRYPEHDAKLENEPMGGSVDAAAHQAATSPHNDLDEPSEAQKEAGNYAKGHTRVSGLDLSIENPEGSTRSGTDPNGKPWSVTMKSHYGYIKGTVGKDKDHVDVFVKPGTAEDWAGTAFVVDQVRPDTGVFDEHKIMLGFADIDEAKAAYRENYAKGWAGLKTISAVPIEELKSWLRDGDTTQPFKQRPAGDGHTQTRIQPESNPNPTRQKLSAEVEKAKYRPVTETRKEPDKDGKSFQDRSRVTHFVKSDPMDADHEQGGMTIDDVRDMLSNVRDKLSEQGRVQDDRLLVRERELVNLAREIEGEPAKSDPERFERSMRAAAHDEERAGDVMTSAGRWVDFDTALGIAREAVESGEVKPFPAQFNMRLDVRMGDADRLLSAIKSGAKKQDNQDEDLGALFDNILAEEIAKLEPAKPATPREKVKAEVERARAPKKEGAAPAPKRTAGQAAKSAAKNTAAGYDAAIDALGALFGGKGTLGSGPVFDEETYAKAKPIFQQAVKHFALAGADIKDMMRAIINDVLNRFGKEVATHMKPYVLRFIEDVKSGAILGADQRGEGDGDHRGNEVQGDEALGEVAAGGDGRVEGGRVIRAERGRRRQDGIRGTGNAPETGVSDARGGGSGPQTVHPETAGVNAPAINFTITADVRLGQGGETEKFNDNLAAIRVLKRIESENRRATPDEQRTLARYVGWGGLANAFSNTVTGEVKKGWEDRVQALEGLLTKEELKAARRSTRNAHYTSETVVRSMWAAAERLGFKGGLVLEPSSGTGNFLGMIPEHLGGQSKFIAVEYDSLTARIAKALYPQSTVLHSGLQKVPLQDGAFTLVIGNPPFGKESLNFQHKPELRGVSIHNQFFQAGLDALQPGGLEVMVVSRYLMDAKDPANRARMAAKAELLGAIRLPDTAFQENARTEVVTDILFLRRREADDEAKMELAIEALLNPPHGRGRQPTPDQQRTRDALLATVPDWVHTRPVNDPLGGEKIDLNRYFATNPDMMLGTLERSGSMQHGADVTLRMDKGADLGTLIDEAIERLPQGVAGLPHDAIKASTDMHESMSASLMIGISGQEPGDLRVDEDGNLVQVYEREAKGGGFELAKRVITEDSPWSSALTQGSDGKWAKLSVVLGEDGKPAKVLNAAGKPTKRNLYEREIFEDEGKIPGSMKIGKTKFERLRDMVGLRDILKEQLNLESSDAAAEDMERNRTKLKAAYDAFVANHGFLSRHTALVAEMPDGALVMALELSHKKAISKRQAEKTGSKERQETATPAPILSKRVLVPYAPPDTADSPTDAMFITLAERGRLDMERIGSLLGTDEAGAIAKLHDDMAEPMAFFDPETQQWEPRSTYLTGLVKRKLLAAKEAGLSKNVEALEKVQPEPWGAENVTPKLGAGWIPTDVYEEFVKHLVGGNARVRYSALTNGFAVSSTGWASSAKATDEWGTPDLPAPTLIEKIMNSTSLNVYREDSDGRRWLDKEATVMGQVKAKQVVSEFNDWVFADRGRRDRMTEIFNEKFNTRVARQHDGSRLTLPGKVPDVVIEMRRHQKNAIWRGIFERFMLLDHTVGAGKTFTAIARVMERRRLGLSKKPMIVVPNHLVEQFAIDVYRLYPGAKVLAAGKADFEKSRRRRLFAKISTGDWDVVIVPHSSFGFIDIAQDTAERFIEQDLKAAHAAIEEAWEQAREDGTDQGRRKPFGVKEAERVAEALENRRDAIKLKARDKLLTFEQLGVDDLTVDEAHEFKNLFYNSRLSGSVRGLGNKTGSAKAYDLYGKVRYLADTPTGSVTFMTGTPISNSAVEMYTLMRYLAAKELSELGLSHFDAWRAQYVDVDKRFEPNEAGQLKEVERLGRSWSNMRSLMELYYSFTDAVTIDDIKQWYAEDNGGNPFPVPRVKGGNRQNVVVQPTPEQVRILEEVLSGFDSLDGISDIEERNRQRLRLMDRARKVSIAARVADRGTIDSPGGKLDVVSDEVKRLYDKWDKDKGAQLVFLDRSIPKSKGDDALLKWYDQTRAAMDKAMAERDEAAYQELADRITEKGLDENAIEAMRDAQRGGWNAYQQIKDNLVARGIPANEIRFIQEANTDEQKTALFDAVKEGSVRVLIGSTPRMGAGTNVQDLLVGLHHVDVTWKPSDIEQREGRIVRFGNKLLEKYGDEAFEVEVLAYATERTVDAKMWSLNATKLKTINAIRKYDGSFNMDMDDSDSVSMAELAALASGNPLLLERVQLMAELDQFELLARAHRRKQFALDDSIHQAKEDIARIPARIEQKKARAETVAKAVGEASMAREKVSVTVEGQTYADMFDAINAASEAIKAQKGDDERAKFSINIDGKRYSNKAAVDEAIQDAFGDAEPFAMTIMGKTHNRRIQAARDLDQLAEETFSKLDLGQSETMVIGQFLGFKMEAQFDHEESRTGGDFYTLTVSLVDADGLTVSSIDAANNITKFGTAKTKPVFERLEDGAKRNDTFWDEQRLKVAKDELPGLEAQLGKPFPQQAEMAEKQRRLDEVTHLLAADGKNVHDDSRLSRASSGTRFAADVLAELADVDEMYRYPISKARDMPTVMVETDPTVAFLGEEDLLDDEHKADRRYVFKSHFGKTFYVYERDSDNRIWINVSNFDRGEFGGAVYAAATAYAYNSGQVFTGDPDGLSETAAVRRLSHMLSSALRYGTTAHLEPHQNQLSGNRLTGRAALRWTGSDVDKVQSLIHAFVSTTLRQHPKLRTYRYDFANRQFVDGQGRPVGPDWAAIAGAEGVDRSSGAGQATVRRAVFLQSLVSSADGERPGLLEDVLARGRSLVRQGGLSGIFSRNDARRHRHGVSVRDAQAVVDVFRHANRNAPTIAVLEDVKKAPNALLEKIKKAGAMDDVEGAFHEGTIYLFPQHLESVERVAAVLVHEGRHFAFSATKGRALDAILLDIYNTNDRVRMATRKKQADLGLESTVEAVEEVLADMNIQTLHGLKGWTALVAHVRLKLREIAVALRRAGYAGAADWVQTRLNGWTDADLAAILRNSDEFVRAGRGDVMESRTRMSAQDGARLEAVEFRSDVPNARWLQEQVDYAKQRGRDSYGVPYMGKVTGYFRGLPDVPLSTLVDLRGERDEQSNIRQDDLNRLVAQMRQDGRSDPPYIEVGYDGVPWVSEGNHRIMAAQRLGWESMPVEIRYFDGGERVDGSLHPDKIRERTMFSRATGTGTLRAKRGPIDTPLRIATQRLGADKLTGGAWEGLQRVVGAHVPEVVKAGAVNDYGLTESYTDARSMMFSHQRQGLRGVQRLMDRIAGLSRAEAAILYQAAAYEPDPGAVDAMISGLPEDSQAALREIKQLVHDLGEEEVMLGLLDAETFERNEWAYLHRSYSRWELGLTDQEKVARQKAKSIWGDTFRMRGMKMDIDPETIHAPAAWFDGEMKGKKVTVLKKARADGKFTRAVVAGKMPEKYSAWTVDGDWEIIDAKKGNFVARRDYTPAERQDMGEIEDIRFATVKTLQHMIHNVEVAKFFEWVAATEAVGEIPAGGVPADPSESMARAFKKDEWVLVPNTPLTGTSVKRYGALAGLYVPGPVWNDIRQLANRNYAPFGKTYATVLKAWKISKTALSPAVHMNNVMANLIMADWHDIQSTHLLKAIKAMASGDRALIDAFEDNGGSEGMYALSELQREQLQPIIEELELELADSIQGEGMVGAISALRILHDAKLAELVKAGPWREAWEAFRLGKPYKVPAMLVGKMIDLYQDEDTVFRLAAFIKAREDGLSDREAGKFARRSFLDYQINAPWIQAMRNTALPFVSFTYRALPMLLDTAAHKPWKLLKLSLTLGAMNALFTAMAGGDDEEDRKYLTKEKSGNVLGFVAPKLIRMPWNGEGDAPVFLDIRRWIPVGDIVDVGQSQSAIPLLPAMIPGGPLVVMGEIFYGKSSFTGEDVVKSTDTGLSDVFLHGDFSMERYVKVMDHLYKAFAPNIMGLPWTYASTKVAEAATGKTDPFGREYSTTSAVLSGFGVKVAAYPKDVGKLSNDLQYLAKEREITDNLRALKRQKGRHGIDQDEYREQVAKEMEKLRRAKQELAQ